MILKHCQFECFLSVSYKKRIENCSFFITSQYSLAKMQVRQLAETRSDRLIYSV